MILREGKLWLSVTSLSCTTWCDSDLIPRTVVATVELIWNYNTPIKALILPSSFVLATLTELLDPSPKKVNANIWHSYSVNLSNPVTFLVRSEALTMNTADDESSEPFLLTNNLNPLMYPSLEPTGGCQEAKILVDVLPVTVNSLGALEWTKI